VRGGQVGGQVPLMGEVAFDSLATAIVRSLKQDELGHRDVGFPVRVILTREYEASVRGVRRSNVTRGCFQRPVSPHAPSGRIALERHHLRVGSVVCRAGTQVVTIYDWSSVIRIRRPEVV